MTSRELVYATLEMKNPPRPPRDLWVLPWAVNRYSKELEEICIRFPSDFTGPPDSLREHPKTVGDMYASGIYVDEWGCRFTSIQSGMVGEIKEPLIQEEDWSDAGKVRFPKEWLTVDVDKVNRFCAASDKFVSSGATPRPFEQLQFMRGTEQFFYDLMERPSKMMAFINSIHEFYCELLHTWAKTDVDTLNIMDDWGTQTALLISPALWREIFKPLYLEYINIAHSAGKKAFMHSDGHILAIYPDLIEIGLDALNSQIFCMGIENLKQYAGKITFWGEVDRQHLLPFGTPQEIMDSIKQVKDNLWRDGGCIAQMEFGAGAKPENIALAFEVWEQQFA
jgi:hypothetical protein